jgi:hypothetical protein
MEVDYLRLAQAAVLLVPVGDNLQSRAGISVAAYKTMALPFQCPPKILLQRMLKNFS